MSTVAEGTDISCAVCQEKPATGRHYGVHSCYGCKSFWRRSIWYNRQYKCKFRGNCPIRRTWKNICRACRLQRCYVVGMLTSAVKKKNRNRKQLLTKLNIIDNNSDNEHSCNSSSTNVSTPLIATIPHILVAVFPTAFSLESINEYFKLNSTLLWESENITALFETVCSRVDVPQVNPKNYRMNSNEIKQNAPFRKFSFSEAFFNPELVECRSKLDLTALRSAHIIDADDCWKRCFVLYADWLALMPHFYTLPLEDQITLAQHRFYVFYLWITATWTLKTKCYGICYSNGSMVEFKHTHSLTNNVAYLHYTRFIQPLASLQCSKFELCAIFLIALFSQINTVNLADESLAACNKSSDKIHQALFVHAFSSSLQNTATLTRESEQNEIQELCYKAVARTRLLSDYADTLLELVSYVSRNCGLHDVYVMNWENLLCSKY